MGKRKYPPSPEIETIGLLMDKRDELQAENDQLRKQVGKWADRNIYLRELMRKQDKKIKVCQFCYRHLKWSKDIQRMVGHADDCEWGKEVANE